MPQFFSACERPEPCEFGEWANSDFSDPATGFIVIALSVATDTVSPRELTDWRQFFPSEEFIAFINWTGSPIALSTYGAFKLVNPIKMDDPAVRIDVVIPIRWLLIEIASASW
jgi:hypothetical protein